MRHRLLLVLLVLAAGLLALPPGASAKTVWLCKPGIANDPCTPGLDTTLFSPTGQRLAVRHIRRERPLRADCFYVYPTISNQPAQQATLRIDPELRSIALYQAARYSRHCRLYAPVYRQITLAGLQRPEQTTEAMRITAYRDVRDAWRTYLRRYNHGRPVVLIGHSQGTRVLRQLVAEEIDHRRAVRRRLVSAILLGGNVLVRRAHATGGDFEHVRACRSRRQIGCVIAFSTFDAPVPQDSRFGRTSELPGRKVLCTNPAALGGGSGLLTPIQPTAPFAPGVIGALTTQIGIVIPPTTTPWAAFPRAYRAHCSHAGEADVLQIAPVGGAPTLRALPDATWGLHLVDANIALGNLEGLVRVQIRNWLRRR